MLYKVYFSDNTVFDGGGVLDTKWNSMPDKPIMAIEHFAFKPTLLIKDYEQYNHLLEWGNLVGTPRNMLLKITVLGIKKDIIDVFCIDYKEKMQKFSINISKEYLSPYITGWKMGFK